MNGGKDMKKHFISMACILAALVSCQKNAAPVQTPQENQPMKVTLTATIGGNDTKISYVDEDNVLKTAWEVGDKVSILALDNTSHLLSNDIFTASAAGKRVDFTGVYTNHEDATQVFVYYPALTEGEGTKENPYMSKPDEGASYGVINDFILKENYESGSLYYDILDDTHLQKINNDPSHLSNQMILKGTAVMEGNNFTTTLAHQSYVIKATLTLPAAGYTVKKMTLESHASEDGYKNITATSWQYIYYYPVNHNIDTNLTMSFGEVIANPSTDEGTGWTLEGNTMTLYMVGHGTHEMEVGDYWSISLPSYLSAEYHHLVGTKTFSSNKTIEPGKMYRLSATLEEQQAE